MTAYVINTCHRFAGLKVSDEQFFLLHFVHTVGKGITNNQREAFRYSYNDDTDSNDEILNNMMDRANRKEML